MELSIFIYFLLTVAICFYSYFKFKFSYWRKRGVPYVEPVIPFGNVHQFNRHMAERVADLYNQLKGQHPFAGIYVLQRPVVLVTDLEFVKTVLIRDFNSFRDRGIFISNEQDDPLAGNLARIDGHRWRNLRTKLTPTFTSGKMKLMFPTIVEAGRRLQATLKDLIEVDPEIELRSIMGRYATDLIGSCAFGIECNSLKDPNAPFCIMATKAFDSPRNGALKMLFMNIFSEWAKRLRLKKNHDDVIKFFTNVVRETINLRKEKNIRRNDFMDLLIQLMDTGKLNDDPESVVGHLTFEQVAAQAFVFFTAGYDTSSSAMSGTIFELALQQDIQDKARRIIKETLKKHDGKLTYESIMEMTYIDQVLNEGLRKYPAGGMLIRKATEDYSVPGTDKIIDKGTMLYIPVIGIHNDPDYYPNPEIYDPDRFAPGVERNNCTFLPFGDGPRNCIGYRFAMMQARVGIVTALMNFKFTTCAKTITPVVFCPQKQILTPKDGLWLHVEAV